MCDKLEDNDSANGSQFASGSHVSRSDDQEVCVIPKPGEGIDHQLPHQGLSAARLLANRISTANVTRRDRDSDNQKRVLSSRDRSLSPLKQNSRWTHLPKSKGTYKPTFGRIPRNQRGRARGRKYTTPVTKFGLGQMAAVAKSDPLELLQTLTAQDESFYALLESYDSATYARNGQPEEESCDVLQAIDRALQCNNVRFRVSLQELVRKTLPSRFFQSYLSKALTTNWLQKMMSPANHHALSVNLERLCRILYEFVQLCPSLIEEMKPLLSDLMQFIKDAARLNADLISPTAEDYRERLDGKLENWKAETQRRSAAAQTLGARSHRNDDKPPPNSFRDVSIMPLPEDVLSPHPGFVRANRVDGRYDDAEHYLDVQFRLLREDFICPLREGIQSYLQRSVDFASLDSNEIRIYDEAFIYPPYIDEKTGDVVHELVMNPAVMGRINWETSKRLIEGTLLCVSHNGFEDIWFGTVHNRKAEHLRHGMVSVCFGNCAINSIAALNVPFVVAESSTYFEAYRHVLVGLQSFRENQLPFLRYLVECNTDVKPPLYLSEGRRRGIWNLGCLMPDSEKEESEVNILSNDWPTPSQLGLDEFQYSALRLALTKELAIIQGPPGTGKTFLGYKVAEVLLNNSHAWEPSFGRGMRFARDSIGSDNEDEFNFLSEDPYYETGWYDITSPPILVVCYTNHALDQFLEGIAGFLPDGIVRVGGRSQSEKLEPFLLKNVRGFRRIPSPIKEWKLIATSTVKERGRYLANIARSSRSVLDHIMTSLALGTVMLPKHRYSLFRSRRDLTGFRSDDVLLIWLLELLDWRSLEPGAAPKSGSSMKRSPWDAAVCDRNGDPNIHVDDDPLIQLHDLLASDYLSAIDETIVQNISRSTVYGWITECPGFKHEAVWLERLIECNDRFTHGQQIRNINNVWKLPHCK